MEMTLNNGFCEMKDEELEIVDVGFGWIGLAIVVGITVTQLRGCSK